MKSIQTKLLMIFSVILLLCGSILSVIIYTTSSNLVVDSVGEQAKGIAEKAAQIVDIEKHEQIASVEDDYFLELRTQLGELKETNGLVYLYTMKRRETSGGQYEYYYVVDGDLPEADMETGYVEEYIDEYPVLKQSFEDGQSHYSLTNTEEFGALVTASYPVKDSQGNVVFVIGADYAADRIYQHLNSKQTDNCYYNDRCCPTSCSSLDFYLKKDYCQARKTSTIHC